MILDFMLPLLERYRLYRTSPSPSLTKPTWERAPKTAGPALAGYAVVCRAWQYKIEAILFCQLLIKVDDDAEFSVAERLCVSRCAHIRELGFMITGTRPGSRQTRVSSARQWGQRCDQGIRRIFALLNTMAVSEFPIRGDNRFYYWDPSFGCSTRERNPNSGFLLLFLSWLRGADSSLLLGVTRKRSLRNIPG